MEDLNQPQFWESRYQSGGDRWDLGQAAPPFVTLLSQPQAPPAGRIAVLGCGRGHEAILFAKHGFEVVGFDFAPTAIAQARQLAGSLPIRFEERDIFNLAQDYAGAFDYVLEHTCFCAIAPTQRPAYVQLLYQLLRPEGELIALFWAHQRAGGPPFGSTPDEIHQLFEPYFRLMDWQYPKNSVPQRQNEEILARWQTLTPADQGTGYK
jgi:SAM-dependent methyltransferase